MSFRCITFANTKGGTGKTSMALGVAWEAQQRGLRTLIVDTDQQGSAMACAEIASKHEGLDAPTTIALGKNVRKELAQVAQSFDLVVIDTPGNTSDRTGGALLAAATAPGGGVAVIPTGSPMDLLAYEKGILYILEQARSLADLDARFLLNGHLSTSTLGEQVRAALLDEKEIPVLRTEIHARTPIQRAAKLGVGVTIFDPGSNAALEVRNLTDELFELLGIDSGGDETEVAA